jgi:hydrogenase maturation protease
MKILVAGVGNVLRVDDGFGVAVIRRLQAEGLPAGVTVGEYGIAGIPFVQDAAQGYDGLIVVDVAELGEPPGTVQSFDGPFAEAEAPPSLHAVDPERSMGLLRALGRLPANVRVVLCQPLETDAVGEALTPPVAAAVPPAADLVRRTVLAWLKRP